jgi:multidrug efflux pump subunit AcrA (membrane-fusion protein)
LSPGDSIRVRVEAGPPRDVITVPEESVGSQQRQKYVVTVTAEDETEFRPVKLGEARDGKQAIESGVTPADRVVVNGLLRVRPGMKVRPKPAGPVVAGAAAPEKSAGPAASK